MPITSVRAGKTPGTSGRRSVHYRDAQGRTREGKILSASTVVAASTLVRATNVVTATVGAGHGLTVGKVVVVDGTTDNTFDGTFTITVANPTDVRWAQVAADQPAGGAGTIQVQNGRRLELTSLRTARATRIRDHVAPATTMRSTDAYFRHYGS